MLIRNKYKRQYVRRWCALHGQQYSKRCWMVKKARKQENARG